MKSVPVSSYFPHYSENYNFDPLLYTVCHSSWCLAKAGNKFLNYYKTETALSCYMQRLKMTEKHESVAL